ncbi:MAG: hypothetical protein AABY22_26965 [Nanoarchaeota archaeon]
MATKKINLIFTINSDGIEYHDVSNLDSDKIDAAADHCIDFLNKINRTYDCMSGSKRNRTLKFELELSEEEYEILEKLKRTSNI